MCSLRPLAEVANLLAEKKDWGRLYDHAQLHNYEVPVVAAAYNPDVYALSPNPPICGMALNAS